MVIMKDDDSVEEKYRLINAKKCSNYINTNTNQILCE